ncbi:hypothetical protein Zmor_001095 [Zophobas morio]|uniref:Uncharacterized protein n=1 Tax=Zophobas morio TaxID=2755281 RepID=A0AA38MS18_9CUCU|nr:hypothetical protein Zmor_001095 [Zophobas morio]
MGKLQRKWWGLVTSFQKRADWWGYRKRKATVRRPGDKRLRVEVGRRMRLLQNETESARLHLEESENAQANELFEVSNQGFFCLRK